MVADPELSGYTFIRWEPALPSTIPAEDITLNAVWEANTDTVYTVEHYFQKLDGTYPETTDVIDNLSGTTDTRTNAVAKNVL